MRPMPTPAILDVQGLRRRYGSAEVVAGVDLRVAAGETVALLGPNGAGKSTTLAMILGLLSPSAGRVTIDGRTPRQAVGVLAGAVRAGDNQRLAGLQREREIAEQLTPATLHGDLLSTQTHENSAARRFRFVALYDSFCSGS